MKSSKSRPKTEDLKTIDPAVLEEILGGVSPSDGKTDTVIPQAPFGSFFHS
ncbi:MAG TPA: hypothetical protein VLT87_24235 [Thermoanaerobaculia bacterium]|nr:hypothetical protein [Thermoanaerobaculia bacterium]